MDALPRDYTYAGEGLEFGRLGAFALRMKVWWSRDRLTRELADGAHSTASRELALRAGQITARRTREVAASSIDDLLDRVDRPAILTAQVPVDRAKLKAVRGELRKLAARLRSAEPLRSRGMALVLILLTDVERPLYGLSSDDELRAELVEAHGLL